MRGLRLWSSPMWRLPLSRYDAGWILFCLWVDFFWCLRLPNIKYFACLVDCTDRFEDSCYLVLNNTEQHDNAVNRWKSKTKVIPSVKFLFHSLSMFSSCREECENRRSHMGSIHSEEENAFVLSLVCCLRILIISWNDKGIFTLGSLPWVSLERDRERLGGWIFVGLSELWWRWYRHNRGPGLKSFFPDSIESASCFKMGFNPDGSWSSVAAEKCFDTRNQPTDCFCKRPA